MASTFYVYLLYHASVTVPAVGKPGSRDTYIGVSKFPAARLVEHNAGKCTATRGRQWKLIAFLPARSRGIAYQIERWLKCGDTRSKRMQLAVHCDANRLVLPAVTDAVHEAVRIWLRVKAARKHSTESIQEELNV